MFSHFLVKLHPSVTDPNAPLTLTVKVPKRILNLHNQENIKRFVAEEQRLPYERIDSVQPVYRPFERVGA